MSKSNRRTKAEMLAFRSTVISTAQQHGPLTLRQLFYRLVAAGAIPKAEAEYRKVKAMVKTVREDADLDWGLILDNVRTSYGQRRYSSVAEAKTDMARRYRRDLMATQSVEVQLWAESDSVASIIWDPADEYGIRTFVGRGHSSRGFIWDAAKRITKATKDGKGIAILHVGDHDPSGEDIYRDLTDTMALYAAAQLTGRAVADIRSDLAGASIDWTGSFGNDLTFHRVAVRPEHERRYGLLTAPPKRSDPRTAKFTGTGTIEAEAFTTPDLHDLVRTAIEAHLDLGLLKQAEAAEEADRKALAA